MAQSSSLVSGPYARKPSMKMVPMARDLPSESPKGTLRGGSLGRHLVTSQARPTRLQPLDISSTGNLTLGLSAKSSSPVASPEASPKAQKPQTFIISGNPEMANVDVLREELQARGLVEKDYESAEVLDFDVKFGPKSKVQYKSLSAPQLVNHFEFDAELTTKSGLAESLSVSSCPVDSRVFYPLCFHLSSSAALLEFTHEFKWSKALCVLKAWLAHIDEPRSMEDTFEEEVARVALAVLKRRLDDLDTVLDEPENLGEQRDFFVKRREWEILQAVDFEKPGQNFALEELEAERTRRLQIQRQSKLMVEKTEKKLQEIAEMNRLARLKQRKTKPWQRLPEVERSSSPEPSAEAELEDEAQMQEEREEEEEPADLLTGAALEDAAREVMAFLRQQPQFGLHNRNIWIMKPANDLRGRGITVENDLEKILRQAKTRQARGTYVCQKYIENPLLVGGARKHDIRQWALVTSVNPLTIYFFSECYVRVSAEEYSLDNLDDRFKHLTHTIIMKHHPNFDADDEYWCCQWTQEAYRRLLKEKAGSDVWTTKVLPAMKQTVISTLLSVQEALSRHETSSCSFQIFGYDFLVDEEFNVWLLEVNDIPMMQASGPVTERLCDTMVRDAVGLMLDGPDRPSQPELRYELIYRAPEVPKLLPLKSDFDLSLVGHKMALPKRSSSVVSVSPESTERLRARRAQELQDLVDKRRQREDKEFQKRERQLRLRHVLASKLLGGDKSVSTPCLPTVKDISSSGGDE